MSSASAPVVVDIEETRDTIAQPAIANDRVAAERGYSPLRLPSRSMTFLPLGADRSRRVVVVSVCIAVASVALAVGIVVWAVVSMG